MFAESTRFCLYERSIYLYNEHTFVPPFSFAYLYYTIIYYIYTKEHSFPHLTFPAPLLPFSHVLFIIYSIYREEYTFPQLFTLFPPFPIVLLYSLYIENDIHFARPFLPLIKWTPFPYFYYSLGKVCGEKFLKTLLV